MIVVLVGVSGSGKTTLGLPLAERLDAAFVEGDDFHGEESRAKMASGVGLTDEERWPWLEALRACLVELDARGRDVVLACSALKAVYRRFLAEGLADVRFVFLEAEEDLLRKRLRERRDHFAKESLLESQLATLEPPREALRVDASRPPEALVEEILRGLEAG